jgi:hypothetical protein
MTDTKTIAKILDAFADSQDSQRIDDVARQCGIAEDVVRVSLSILTPLGLFELDETNGRVSWRARKNKEVSQLAARSIARAIGNGTILVGDWNALSAEPQNIDDIFSTGSHFLWTLERRRYARGDRAPISAVKIARIVFKARGKDGLPYVLMHYGKNPQRFQIIGGRIEEDDKSIKDALMRRIAFLNCHELSMRCCLGEVPSTGTTKVLHSCSSFCILN